MIWATFEHLGNTPDSNYFYINNKGDTITVGSNTTGSWLFCADNATGPFNQALMQLAAPNIQSTGAAPIGPSNTIRMKPWGSALDDTATALFDNTAVISINNSVLGNLIAGDPRKNYILRGATWTIEGLTPTTKAPLGGTEFGTTSLSNSTMETYDQGRNTSFTTGSNCLDCHQSAHALFGDLADTGVSHVYSSLKPLF
jgi:hypothetical protein